MEVTALPCLLCYYLFRLVVDIEYRGCLGFALLEIEGPEHARGTQICRVNQKVVVFSKGKLRLPYHFGLSVANIDILDHIGLLVFLTLSFVADAHQHEAILGRLPHCVHGHLHCVHPVWNAYLLF